MRKINLINRLLICLSFVAVSLSSYAAFAGENSIGHYIQVSDDLTLFYRDEGTGPVLLFIPGWTMSSEVFKSQIDFFSKKYRDLKK